MAHLSCLIFADADDPRIELGRHLDETGHIGFIEETAELDAIREAVSGPRHHDAVFAVLEAGDEIATLDGLGSLGDLGRPLIVLGPADRSDLILRSMRIGALEYLSWPPPAEDLSSLLDRLMLQPARLDSGGTPAPLIAVMGSKGGVGGTVVACQLAGTLQELGRKTCLVDLDLRNGDVALHYDLHPSYSLADVARSSVGVDSAYIQSVIETHSSGVSIVAAPRLPEDAELIRPSHVESSLDLLRRSHDIVVVDLPRTWDEVSLRVLDLASQVILVFTHDLPALARARHHLELMDRVGISPKKVHLLANRLCKANGVNPKEAERFLGRGPDLRIPNDYGVVMESVTSGVPLCSSAPNTPVYQALDRLGRELHGWCGLDLPETEDRKRGFSLIPNFMRRGNHGAD